MPFTDIYTIAGSAMTAQIVHLNTVTSNLANAASANPDDVTTLQLLYHHFKQKTINT